jgi:phospholipase C
MAAALTLIAFMVVPSTMAVAHPKSADRSRILGHYDNIVVIFQENHSFDNLYGGWGQVGRDRVMGLDDADAAHRTQVDQNHTAFACLPQNDVNLTSPPLASRCTDPNHGISQSAFINTPFTIDDYIAPTDATCPLPGAPTGNGTVKGSGLEGGCTRDLVHRFYQEKYQINGGHQNRYVTASDALGLTMGVYDTSQLPIYEYLHQSNAPHYVIADRFFQGANGGSFLNHQWLIAGRAPFVDANGAIPSGATRAANSIVDSNGMPGATKYYTPTTTPVRDAQLTASCDNQDVEDYEQACGNFAVNTVQPANLPRGGGAVIPLIDDAKYPNIGDRLTSKGISWAWYSGGWDDAEAGHPGPLFQYHHQPFNYYAAYAPGTPGRAHLQDVDNDFLEAATVGNLPRVSFVKPYGAENEHPGYASASDGSDYLVKLIKAVTNGPQAVDTLFVVTFDEYGGQWDHVSPPGKGSPTKGAYDAFGPGTRIPALLLSADMHSSGVDHTVYDTTSIITSLENSFHLKPVGLRDQRVPDLRRAVQIGQRHRG